MSSRLPPPPPADPGETSPADSDTGLSRGGRKLAAALERFDLGQAVRGARAIDVGASTGGFTEVLLRHGAAHVTAVDVGHGQLAAALRADPRVAVLERADWKRLALDIAPGPFDFFTVDVSFVAARNMLRGLAFRLRAGAQGVILVKPQFELPPRELAAARAAGGGARVAGAVDDAALRARAVEAVRRKGEPLGFDVVGWIDSPVAGGGGTVEALAHLRFRGRTARLPQPGERRRDAPPRAVAPTRAHAGARTTADAAAPDAATTTSLRWFLVAAPGLEEIVRAEAAEILTGATRVARVDGGVEVEGPPEVGYRANLWLRTPTRVLARVGAPVTARDFAPLRRALARLPWEDLVAPGASPAVTASTTRCRLYHTGALAEVVADAIADRLRELKRAGASTGARARSNADTTARASDATDADAGASDTDDADPARDGDETTTRILLRGVEDAFVASVDASGELLHRRGWRQETGKAPLRETLAAAILRLAGWDPTTPLVDPMCGAGTLALEACTRAMRMAPGLARGFAFQRWPRFARDAALWERLHAEAAAAVLPAPPAAIVASDQDAGAVEAARRNADRAGVATHVAIERRSFIDVRPPDGGPGLVVANPPYGRRIGTAASARRLLADLGRWLRAAFGGWRAALVVTEPDLARRALALPFAGPPQPFTNGGLHVHLVIVDVPPIR